MVFDPFSYSITNLRPQRWAELSADFARAASQTVSNSTKAKPRCCPSIFLGKRIFFRLPYQEKSSFSQFLVASKARFLTSSLLFLASSFWIFSLRAFNSSTFCTFFLERLRMSLCPSTSTLFNRLIASSAFKLDYSSTKPKPIDLPCLFLTILAYLRGPIFSKISQMLLSQVQKLRFFMQTTLLNSPAYSSSFSIFSICFTMFASLIIPKGANQRQMKLFLNLWLWRFFITLSANSGLWNSAIAMARLGAIMSFSIMPQNYSSYLSYDCWVRQLRFFISNVCLLRSHKFRSFQRKSRLMPSLAIHSLVYWMTSASASATLGARLSESRISDLVMCSFLAIRQRMVLGLRKSVFQLVVSLSLSLISLFFFFLQEDFSSIVSPYFSLIFSWYSASLPVFIISPMSSSDGLMWMILPKTTLLSSSANALSASSDFWQVMKKKPLLFPSYYLGNLILVMLPKRENAVLISYQVSLQGMLVMQRRFESTYKGFVTNFLFFQLKRGALIGFTNSQLSFFSFFQGYSLSTGAFSVVSTFFLDFGLLFFSSSGSKAGCSGTMRSSHDFLVCS